MIEATYRIPESVLEDTRAFRGQVEKYLAGETSPVAFRGIRVPMGIYEQRENDTYMVRVRGAAGLFLEHQAKVIANLADTYGNGIVHVTTRQDLQIHGVRIEDTPLILDRLLEVGLSSRGGGGNTVRNISACPHAGACSDEVFDVTPYALALTEYLIRERGNFNLPRKFKVAFSGCGRDCGLCSVADLGFFAHERDGAPGFAVYAGGGMGAHSALGVLIEEFIPSDAVFEVAEAVKRLFDRYGDRADRNRARLRFVVQRLGVEVFRRAYRDELEHVRLEGISTPGIDRSTVHRRNDARHAVTLRLPLGDIPARRLELLADLAFAHGDGTLRTTQEQNIQLRGVPEGRLQDLHAALRSMDERYLAPASIRCVACAGASTCKLGLCLSRGLAEALDAELRGIKLPLDAVIRISGCPNSCGHHPIAALGLYGTASRVNGRLVPFYRLVAGGRVAEGDAALAQPVARVPAKAIPAMLKEFWTAAATEFKDDEALHELMDRWGIDKLRELAGNYEQVPSYDAEPDYYRDFGCVKDFSLAGRGPGECGAGVTDVIALDIDQAKRALLESRLYDAVIASARALLITKGLEPQKDREVLAAFSEHLIAPGWVAKQTQSLLDAAMDLKLGDRDDLNDLRDGIEALVARIEELFHSLDSNLNFRVDSVEESESVDSLVGRGFRPPTNENITELDLRGVACPMNFVRAKIQLEQIDPGAVLDVLLDDGEPVRNVPASFVEQGQEVLSVEAEQAHYRVRVRRVE
ncbi:MAG: sulfurtransferase TusA family protein [Armatimonadetes bacterium]|nr:sulfurtransferase TusA family protein [Armatimonadota bacterium]